MKQKYPNQIVNLQNNFFIFPSPLFLNIKRVLLLLVFVFYGATVSAQVLNSNNSIPTIMEVKSFITALRASEQNSGSTYSSAQNVENLLYNIQPSIYLTSGGVKTYGEKPKNLFTDIPSLNGLNNLSLLKNNIEIVIIKIDSANDLNSKIDLSVFSGFTNLKYIYILSRVTTTEQKITSMISNYDEKYSVFYKIDSGDTNQ